MRHGDNRLTREGEEFTLTFLNESINSSSSSGRNIVYGGLLPSVMLYKKWVICYFLKKGDRQCNNVYHMIIHIFLGYAQYVCTKSMLAFTDTCT